MPHTLKLGFTSFGRLRGVLITFCAENVKFGPATQKALSPLGDLVRRAAAADRFTGKNGSTLDIIAPAGLNVPRLVVVGTGKESDLKDRDITRLGGIARGKVPKSATQATIFTEFAGRALKAEQVANLALGVQLRDYAFDRYKTKRKEDEERADKIEVNLACANPSAAEKAWARTMAIGDGVVMARDLVNEPANVLYPGEFARRASGLRKLGVLVEVLDVAAMKKLGFQRDKDYTMLYVGNSPLRMIALEQGRVDASIFSPQQQIVLASKGYPLLTDVGRLLPEVPALILSAMREKTKSNPEQAVRFLRAMQQAMNLIRNDPDRALEDARKQRYSGDFKMEREALKYYYDAYSIVFGAANLDLPQAFAHP